MQTSKGVRVVGCVAVLSTLLMASLWYTTSRGDASSTGRGPVYTIPQLRALAARHPGAWVGRDVTVYAKATALAYQPRLPTGNRNELFVMYGPDLSLPETDVVHLVLTSSTTGPSPPILWARLRVVRDPVPLALRRLAPWLNSLIPPPRTHLSDDYALYRLRLLRSPTAPCRHADCDVATLVSIAT